MLKKKDSSTALKSIYFDSSNCSTISPFIDFGNYSGLVSIYASKQAIIRLETIVLDVKCQDDITITNSATDTFVIYPQSGQQCVFPFPKCDVLSVNFFPTFQGLNLRRNIQVLHQKLSQKTKKAKSNQILIVTLNQIHQKRFQKPQNIEVMMILILFN